MRRLFGRSGPNRLEVGAAIAIAALGLQLRSRARALPTLEPSRYEPDPDHLFLALRGVEPDDATRRAASAHARREGLDVLDLVPGDLDVERACEVLGRTDPGTYRTDRLAVSRGPVQAMLVTRDVADRAKLDVGEELGVASLALSTETAKRYASTTSDIAVAPDLTARPLDPAEHAGLLRTTLGFIAHPQVGTDILLALVLGYRVVSAARRRRPSALVPVVAHALQPLIALAGTNIRPADLGRATWGRWPRRLARLVGIQRELLRPGSDAESVEAQREVREVYDGLLAAGTEAFFEPRRRDCYLCSGTDLAVAVEASDLVQLKPGRFVFERCGGCGHVFQNPPLSPEGLDFYYRDFYDGSGGRLVDQLTDTQARIFRDRAEMLRGLTEPARWIDIGADRGQFCAVAGGCWPDTRFDGLDLSASIDEAQRRGWVERGYRHQLVDVVDDLAGSYDVVSMHHYLEHTRDPRAELDAATRLLRPGGHLQIEVPDPEFPGARLLGGLWSGWVPMQHLHLLPIGRLEALLEERGYHIVRRARGEAHMGRDMVIALYMLLQRLAPPPHLPWRPPSTRAAQLRHGIAFGLAGPAFVPAFLADLVLDAATRAADRSNTYRIVARASGGS